MKSFKFLLIIIVLISFQSYGMGEDDRKEEKKSEDHSGDRFVERRHRCDKKKIKQLEEKVQELRRDLIVRHLGLIGIGDSGSSNSHEQALNAEIKEENPLSVDSQRHDSMRSMRVYGEEYKNAVYDILWEKLDPLPPELIAIILSYLPQLYELKGEQLCIIDKIPYKDTLHLYENSRPFVQLLNGLLASISFDHNSVHLLDPSTGQIKTTYRMASAEDFITNFVELARDRAILTLASNSQATIGKIALYNLGTGACISEIPVERCSNLLAKLSKRLFAVAHSFENNKIQIWKAPADESKTLELKKTISIPGMEEFYDLITVSRHNKLLAVSGNKQICVYNWKMGQPLQAFETEQFFPGLYYVNNQILISHSHDDHNTHELKLWDSRTGHHVRTIIGENPVRLPNGLLAILHHDLIPWPFPPDAIRSKVKLVDPTTGECKKELTSKECFNRILALSNGYLALSLSGDKFKVWQ